MRGANVPLLEGIEQWHQINQVCFGSSLNRGFGAAGNTVL
jgi:hypothetical protein